MVGIFLGLQVDDWNEARKDAAREKAYLERLLADVDAVVRSSFDEMVAAGALACIGDRRLKTKISEIYSQAVAAQQFIEYFTAILGRASDIIWRHVSFDMKTGPAYSLDPSATWTPETYSLAVAYDFDALCNASTFRNALVEVFDSTKDRLGVGTAFANELRSLRGLLEETLGRE